MAPKELEKVLYFAASIVTWIDEEARTKDLTKLEKEVKKVLDGYTAEQGAAHAGAAASRSSAASPGSRARPTSRSSTPRTSSGPSALGVNPKKLDDAERTKLAQGDARS